MLLISRLTAEPQTLPEAPETEPQTDPDAPDFEPYVPYEPDDEPDLPTEPEEPEEPGTDPEPDTNPSKDVPPASEPDTDEPESVPILPVEEEIPFSKPELLPPCPQMPGDRWTETCRLPDWRSL